MNYRRKTLIICENAFSRLYYQFHKINIALGCIEIKLNTNNDNRANILKLASSELTLNNRVFNKPSNIKQIIL